MLHRKFIRTKFGNDYYIHFIHGNREKYNIIFDMSKLQFPPDNRDSFNNNLDRVHHVILRMLKIVSQISKELDISIWLEYGTMLGAVRHKGFIPWDTEADIGILRKDFEKLCKNAKRLLPEDIFFQTKHSDPYYSADQFIEAKFRDKYSNYTTFRQKNPNLKWHNGIQIDVFVFDAYILSGEKCLINNYEKLLTGCKSYYRFEEIEEILEYQFEDAEFYIPSGYDSYLKRTYGNYMELPPEECRISEETDVYNPCDHPEILYWK